MENQDVGDRRKPKLMLTGIAGLMVVMNASVDISVGSAFKLQVARVLEHWDREMEHMQV